MAHLAFPHNFVFLEVVLKVTPHIGHCLYWGVVSLWQCGHKGSVVNHFKALLKWTKLMSEVSDTENVGVAQKAKPLSNDFIFTSLWF